MTDGPSRDRRRFTQVLSVLVFILLSVLRMDGATVSYDLHFEEGPGGFALKIVFDDDIAGNPNAIRADVTLTPGPNTGDIVAVYVNLNSSLVRPLPASLTNIMQAIEGVHITHREIDTRNVQSGSVGATYSIGLAIGTEGYGGNDIHATSFLLNTPGLTLQHLGSVAARVTSIGPVFGQREDSAKLADNYGVYLPDDASGVPEPRTLATVGAAVAGLAMYRRARLPFRRS